MKAVSQMNSLAIEIVIVLLLILANGLFSMSEMAIVSARRNRLQQRAESGSAGALAALRLGEDPTRFFSTVQIGITLIGILSGALGGATLAKQLGAALSSVPGLAQYGEAIGVGVVVLVITYLSLVIGELVPKRLAQNNAEGVALLLASPMSRLSRLAGPLVSLLSFSTEAMLRLLGARPSQDAAVTEEDVRMMISEGAQVGVFEPKEQEIVERVFRLGDRKVGALMTYRTDVVWLDIEDPLEANLQIVMDAGHALYPVCRQTPDNVLGLVRVKDLFSACRRPGLLRLEDLMQPALVVPEAMTALELLERLRHQKAEMALIVDEFGGLVGLVTLKDILDSLVGDLPTPGDMTEPDVVQRTDGSLLLNGSLPVDELKEVLDVDMLPGEGAFGYATLGGMLMSQLGRIPRSGDTLTWSDLRFEVMDMDGHRVDKVLVSKIPSN
jgi:putative hemolysin